MSLIEISAKSDSEKNPCAEVDASNQKRGQQVLLDV
jgi:hypothetical protein